MPDDWMPDADDEYLTFDLNRQLAMGNWQ